MEGSRSSSYTYIEGRAYNGSVVVVVRIYLFIHIIYCIYIYMSSVSDPYNLSQPVRAAIFIRLVYIVA